jgi:hypothetical protein
MHNTLKEYLSLDDVEDIHSTAQLAHLGQKRRSGEDYFSHPVEVARIIKDLYPGDTHAYLVALLHDTLEDTESVGNITIPELEQMISGSITDRAEYEVIIKAVRSLTHSKNMPYTNYLLSLASSPLALRVKLADMLHNLSTAPTPKQVQKYGNALEALDDEFGGTPPGVSVDHMDRLENVVIEGALRSVIRNIIIEAEYQGRTVKVNKPTAIRKGQPGYGKQQDKVYVKDGPDEDDVKVVRFGDPDSEIRSDNPKAKKSFRARHNCDAPGPKTKARYWSCKEW